LPWGPSEFFSWNMLVFTDALYLKS
jgi:hypothetical protein